MGMTWPLILCCWAGLWTQLDRWPQYCGITRPPWMDDPDPPYTFGGRTESPEDSAQIKNMVREFIEAVQAKWMQKDDQENLFNARDKYGHRAAASKAVKAWAKTRTNNPTWTVLRAVEQVIEDKKMSMWDEYRRSKSREVRNFAVSIVRVLITCDRRHR